MIPGLRLELEQEPTRYEVRMNHSNTGWVIWDLLNNKQLFMTMYGQHFKNYDAADHCCGKLNRVSA